VLAIVLPLAIVTYTLDLLRQPVELHEDAVEFEEKLEASKPKLLILGSSVARRDVDTSRLAEQLGIKERSMLMLTLPNATGAHFYAVLKNRVYGNGHRPKAVVVVSALGTLLTTEVLGDSNMDRLVHHLSPDEPVIARKVFERNGDSFESLQMRAKAGDLRDGFTGFIRDVTAGYLFPGGKNKLRRMVHGERLANDSFDSVFANENMDFSLYGKNAGQVGVVVEEEYSREVDPWDSFMVDLTEIGADHRSKIFFVRTPFPPSNPDKDRVDSATDMATRQVLQEIGAGYMDFRSLDLDDSYFEDMVHMNPEGARIMTDALADELLHQQLFDMDVKPEVDIPDLPDTIRRVGNPPKAPQLGKPELRGDGCRRVIQTGAFDAISDDELARRGVLGASPVVVRQGELVFEHVAERSEECAPQAWFAEGAIQIATPDKGPVKVSLAKRAPILGPNGQPAYWVYPGTSLELSFPSAFKEPEEAFEVYAQAAGFGGDGGVPTLEVEDQAVEMDSFRGWVHGVIHPPAPKKAWSLRLSSPEDGPWLLVRNITVGMRPKTTHVIGDAESLYGASIRVLGGRVEHTGITPEYVAPPPKPIRGLVDVKKGPKGLGSISLPRFQRMADVDDPEADRPNDCSPLVVFEDDVALSGAHSPCEEVALRKGGRYCHAGPKIYLSGSDDSSPSKNGRSYRVGLDESRICTRLRFGDQTPFRDIWWMYPGDELEVRLPPESLDRFRIGLNRLEVGGFHYVGDDADKIDVRVKVDGEVVLREEITAADLDEGWDHVFEPPLERSDDVVIGFRNIGEETYFLLNMIAVSESYETGRREYVPSASEGVSNEQSSEVEEEEPLPGMERFEVWPHPTFPPTEVVRHGTAPQVSELKKIKGAGDGLWQGQAFSLWPVSNSVMQTHGLGWWSPLRVFENGEALVPAGSRQALRGECPGCFLHLGQSVVYSPSSGTGDGEMTVDLSDEVPFLTMDGQEVYWVYPHTRLEFSFDGWPGGSLTVMATTVGFGQNPQTADLIVGDKVIAIAKGRDRKQGTASFEDWPNEPFVVQIDAPVDATWFLLAGLRVGTEDWSVPVFPPPIPP